MHGKMNGMPGGLTFNKETFKRILSYFEKYKFLFIIVILTIIVSSLSQVIMQTFIKDLIDEYIRPLMGENNPNFTGLIHAILSVAVVCVFGIISAYTYNKLMIKISQGILKDIRINLFTHMQKLPIKYFDTHLHGDVMSHYTNDTDTLRQMIGSSVPQFISSCVTIIGTLAAMFYLNVTLTFVVLIGVFVMISVTKQIASKSGSYFIKQQKSLGNLNGYIEEMIVGQKVIKVFTREEEIKSEFDKLNEKLCDSSTKANMYANTLMPIMMNLGYLIYVVVAIVGGILATSGINTITLGTIAAFLTLTRSFTNPVSQISGQLNSIVMALAGATRIFKLMDEPEEVDEGRVKLVKAKEVNGKLKEVNKESGVWAWKKDDGSLVKLEGDVRFKDVVFSYDGEKIVLENVSLYAKPGQKIAFVGSTGAGKTTITNLINRFYDVDEGVITFDGINVLDIEKSSLRKSLGIVLQDTNLFTGTILDNVRYGKIDATKEEVINACKIANAHDFISLLPKGYDTLITGNGSNLSQGERQLLAIARSILADAPVMILDEATSSIDTRTEKLIAEGMDKLMEGRTNFVIAHRLSTIKNANAIMVLDKGNIIERGTHEELLKLKGRYYELYTGLLEIE